MPSSPKQDGEYPAVVVTANELAEEIETAWLRCQNAVSKGNKDHVRKLHVAAKRSDETTDYKQISKDFHRHSAYFPSGAKLSPEFISPELIPVRSGSLEEKLFRIVRAYWSMPYSKGYGRRLRFLVVDRAHDSVIGILGLQSPSADLACRDDYLGMPKHAKLSVVNNTLDAYTIGATPTYAPLRAGKLVAGLLHSTAVRQEYWRAYGGKETSLLQKRVPQPLLAITTASAFGRSSIYNRLKFGEELLAKPIGYTKGFGTLHLEGIYPHIVAWLRKHNRHVPAGFGNGPKVRWQNIMRALIDLQASRKNLEHGLMRQVFIFELVHNLKEVCTRSALPDVRTFDESAWSEYWKDRWCLPRVRSHSDWYEFDVRAAFRSALAPQ